jgi:hypothetical protein
MIKSILTGVLLTVSLEILAGIHCRCTSNQYSLRTRPVTARPHSRVLILRRNNTDVAYSVPQGAKAGNTNNKGLATLFP